MKSESEFFENREATTLLPPDFAQRVLRQANLVRRQRQLRRRWAATTLGLGLLLVGLSTLPFARPPEQTLPSAESETTPTNEADYFADSDIEAWFESGDTEAQSADFSQYFFPDSQSLLAEASD